MKKPGYFLFGLGGADTSKAVRCRGAKNLQGKNPAIGEPLMTKIIAENQGNIAVITLNNGITSARSPDRMAELSEKTPGNKKRSDRPGAVRRGACDKAETYP
jgi:hypothetical protein